MELDVETEVESEPEEESHTQKALMQITGHSRKVDACRQVQLTPTKRPTTSKSEYPFTS